jgi:diguanylate cyclase (GGDEF)-like protein
MAASDSHNFTRPAGGSTEYLSGGALWRRLEEEVNRTVRHGTGLSCLLVDIEDLHELERDHGAELAERALAYVGLALRRELRDFDRVGRLAEDALLVVLPGTDGPRGEVVARRVLRRLRAIKLQDEDSRRTLRVAVGLATWREGMSAGGLVADTRAAARRERLGFQDALRL